MTKLLVPGLSCADVFPSQKSGVLVDGEAFYRAVYEACCKAERSIVMAGWQFATWVDLVRGEDAKHCKHPTKFVEFLRALCDEKPDLQIHLLGWDSSPVFAFEREPLQRLTFHLKGHVRIHYEMDNSHPRGASHHQKLIIVDRSIAFLGGMDVCNARWDDRRHLAWNLGRYRAIGMYAPYHDVQAYVTGDPVDTLRSWFCERWRLATGEALELPDVPPKDIAIEPSFDVEAPCIGLARTWPRTKKPPHAPICELLELHLRAIASAEQLIYLENQYLSSDEIADALEHRMLAFCDRPLEIAFVLPAKSAGFKERISLGIAQARILERLGAVAERTGHRLGVYYSCAAGKKGEVPVFIHSKVLVVDDRFLLVSSANTTNRSMGFDTELGMAWESPVPSESLRAARIDLMREHAGLSADEAKTFFAETPALVARLDELARAKSHRLRIHKRNVDEKPGRLLRALLPEKTPFDPDDPQSFDEALPEPSRWFTRFVGEPLSMLRRRIHLRRRLHLWRRNKKQLKAG